MKTVKQIALEQGVSKQTIHRIVRKRSLETFPDGNKVMLDDAAEAAIIEELQNRQTAPGSPADDAADDSGRSENVPERPRTSENDSPDEGRTVPDPVQLLTAQVELLQSQLEDLKADKAYLQERLTAAEQERDSLTKERQTLVIELLELREPKVIEVKGTASPAPDPIRRSERRSRSEQRSPAAAPGRSGTQKQQRTKMTLADRLRKIFK